MESVTRERIAFGICLVSAIVGAVFIARGHGPASVLMYIAWLWVLTADWLGRRPSLLKVTPPQIYKAAKRGNLKLPAPARFINHGSMLLFLAAIVALFF